MTATAPEARLLVVDDEQNIVELLFAALRFAGFEVETAASGLEALDKARTFRPDLVVLDVTMPELDGFGVVRRLRQDSLRMPVVFLTAKDATDDKVQKLTIGGDDYITKPFSREEVVARVRTVLRRVSASPGDIGHLSFAGIELDADTHEVWKDGVTVPLSPMEFKLLRYFMQNTGRVLSRPQILDHVWNYDFEGTANVVESHVCYLRRKLDNSEPRLLHTLRGVGYTMRLPGS